VEGWKKMEAAVQNRAEDGKKAMLHQERQGSSHQIYYIIYI